MLWQKLRAADPPIFTARIAGSFDPKQAAVLSGYLPSASTLARFFTDDFLTQLHPGNAGLEGPTRSKAGAVFEVLALAADF